jgi:hypothetical protein
VLGGDGDLVDGDEAGVLGLALADDPVGLAAAGVYDLVALVEQGRGPPQLAGELGAELVEGVDHLTAVDHAVCARHGDRAGGLHDGDDLVDAVERVHLRLTPVVPQPTLT